MSCLFAVTTDLPAASALRIQPSTGFKPPISSTTISTSERRISSMSSVQTTDAGTALAASVLRLRSTLRLKICVSSTPGNFDAASTRATELPTVPNPSNATFTSEPVFTALTAVFFIFLIFLIVNSAHLSAPCIKARDCLLRQQTYRGNSPLIYRSFYLFIQE